MMIDTFPTTYHHTQRGPWYLLVYAISLLPLIAAYIVRNNLAIATLFLFAAIAISTEAASVQHLTVIDEGDRLRIKFGPIPLFQRSVRFEDIEHVEVTTTPGSTSRQLPRNGAKPSSFMGILSRFSAVFGHFKPI